MKLKNKILTTLAACLFSYSVANAQISASSFNKGTFYYGLEYYHYSEVVTGQDPFMTTKSNPWPLITLGYSDFTNIRSSSKTEYPFIYFIEGAYGQVNYSSASGKNDHNDYKFQGEVSYVLPANFYLGLGYRYLYDYLGDAQPSGYDRRNQLAYIPFGYGLKMADGSNAKFQFNYLIEGKQRSYYSQTSSVSRQDSNNTQKNGWGLDFSYVPTISNWEFYTRYWKIGNSNWVNIYNKNGSFSGYIGQEPSNQTYEIGFKHTF
jgi:hypothetical protein